jgi:hypothetical protein
MARRRAELTSPTAPNGVQWGPDPLGNPACYGLRGECPHYRPVRVGGAGRLYRERRPAEVLRARKSNTGQRSWVCRWDPTVRCRYQLPCRSGADRFAVSRVGSTESSQTRPGTRLSVLDVFEVELTADRVRCGNPSAATITLASPVRRSIGGASVAPYSGTPCFVPPLSAHTGTQIRARPLAPSIAFSATEPSTSPTAIHRRLAVTNAVTQPPNVPPRSNRPSCPTHLLHRRSVPPMWLTARLTRFAFSGCDDEHSQAQRRVGV